MAGIDPRTDARGARWEHRLHLPVVGAAWLALPTVFLYFSEKHGPMELVAVGLSWLIWLVFLAEAAIMLTVVADRRGWIRHHLFGLAIVVATFPLLTHILEGLLAARALSTLAGARVLQVLYLAKAAKILKSMQILHRRGRAPRHPVAATALIVALAVVAVGIVRTIVTHEKATTPLHGAWKAAESLPHWSIGVAAGAAFALAVGALTARRARPAAEAALAPERSAGAPPAA